MPQPIISFSADTKQVERMMNDLLKKVRQPKKLMSSVERYVAAMTVKMFRGPRPDTVGVRGVKWPKLADSTIKQKRALVKRGKAIVADRPMVRTGMTRDSLKVLSREEKGFLYGTNIKSKKGFPYPGYHNQTKFPWLFLRKHDFAQMTKMIVDFLEGKMSAFKNYSR
jgi:hypothetical protein